MTNPPTNPNPDGNPDPLLPENSAGSTDPTPSSKIAGGKDRRFLVVLADPLRVMDDTIGGRKLRWMFNTSANVLARDEDEAMFRAQDALADKDFLPIAVLTPEGVKALLDTLETVQLCPAHPVKYNHGRHVPEDELGLDDRQGVDPIDR